MYSIKEISILSGIMAHTIRVWEKRYNMFTPSRTQTNIRRYSDDDLKLALNITMLLSMGYKISKIAKMSSAEISSIVTNGNQHVSPPPVPETLLMAAINLDRLTFTDKLNEIIRSKGIEWAFENLIVPLQERMGLLWQAGTISPAQEHFVSNIIRETLIKLSSDLSLSSNARNEKIIFYLPEGERHEISLLYFNYIANNLGFQTIYLGQDVPINDVLDVAQKHGIKKLFTSFTINLPIDEFNNHIEIIMSSIPNVSFFITGKFIEQNRNKLPDNMSVVASAKQFKEFLF